MRDSNAKPIVGPARKRPLLNSPYADIARDRLRAMIGKPRSNPTRESRSEGERCLD